MYEAGRDGRGKGRFAMLSSGEDSPSGAELESDDDSYSTGTSDTEEEVQISGGGREGGRAIPPQILRSVLPEGRWLNTKYLQVLEMYERSIPEILRFGCMGFVSLPLLL